MFLFFDIIYLTISAVDPQKKTRELYCLCAESRFDRCKNELQCDTYQVPADHYITPTTDSAFKEISLLNNSDVYIYLTSAGSADSLFNIRLNGFQTSNNIIRFLSVDSGSNTNLALKESKIGDGSKFECVIQGISSIAFEQGVLDVISELTLKNSPLSVEDSIKVDRLVTDSGSISSFRGTVNIITNLTFNNAVPVQQRGKFILSDNVSVNIIQSSSFPLVSLRPPNSDDDCILFVYLSDVYEDHPIKIGLESTGSREFFFTENTLKMPSISVVSRIEENVSVGDLQFNFFVPTQGMNVMFNKTDSCINLPDGFSMSFADQNETEKVDENQEILLQLALDAACKEYNITKIEGDINLRLMSRSTVETILSLIDQDKVQISSVESLTINLENFLTAVTFSKGNISLSLGGSEASSAEVDNISLKNEVSDAFFLISSSKKIAFNIEDGVDEIHNLTVLTSTENAEFEFDSNFTDEFAKCINISHKNIPVTIKTDAKFVPLVAIDDPVMNVSFVSSAESPIKIESQEAADAKNQRAGPNVTYEIGSGPITFYQEVCLAENVTFSGEDFIFEYENEAVSSYVFRNNVCVSHKNGASNEFRAASVAFENDASFIPSLGSTKCQINPTIKKLDCGISSIPASAFSSPIKVMQLSIQSEDKPGEASRVFFSKNSVRFDGSAQVQQMQNGNEVPHFEIFLNGQNKITLSYENPFESSKSFLEQKKVVQNTFLYLIGDSVNIFIDKSWYKVDIPESFKIVLEGQDTSANVETELIEMPNFTFYYKDGDNFVPRTDFTYSKSKEPFVKTTGFKVLMAFVGVIGAVIIIAVIALIVHQVKRKKGKKENFDDSANNTNYHVLV